MAALGGGYETRPEEKKRLIVNEQGEFVRPADLQKTMGGPLFSPYEEEEQEFLFDDDLDWRASVQSLPVRRRAGSRPPEGQPNRRPEPGRRKPAKGKDRGRGRETKPWKNFLYVFIIALCFFGMCVLGVMMMPQMAGYFWKDFGNYAFINGELLRYDSRAAASYRQYKNYMAQNVIYPGVFVDGVSVGGMTVEEALVQVDLFLDGAQMNSLKTVTIIHGKGTGALRAGIHSHLKRHPGVAEFRLGRYGEGEDGVTIVTLK